MGLTRRTGSPARQKVAIIGGGTAGLVTAYLLSGRQEVTLFEAGHSLGGNVRTLNANVPCAGLDAELTLDAGVIELEESTFHALRKLLDELKVERRRVPGTTALFLRNGRHYRSPANIANSGAGLGRRGAICAGSVRATGPRCGLARDSADRTPPSTWRTSQ